MVTLNISDDVSRLEFAHLPTKIEPMEALQKALGGPNLFVKRDARWPRYKGGIGIHTERWKIRFEQMTYL